MHPSSDELPWGDLGRWLAGEMDPDEAAAMERWVAADPDRAELVAMLRQAWTEAGAAGEGWDAARAVRRVREAAASEVRIIARLGGDRPETPAAPSRSSWLRPALRIAAAIAIVAGGATAALRLGVRPAAEAPAPAPVEMAEYRTNRGQRLALRLADGTEVMLAPGSVLRRPADYGQRERRLELEGHAYFVVTHDSTRPFTVHTPRLIAYDLGTRFDVRAYPEDSIADVAVAEGKVAVTDRPTLRLSDAKLLTAGQLARTTSTGVTVSPAIDVEQRFAWVDGKLLFRDTPLRDVAAQVARWYDVDIDLSGAGLERLRVTGTFGHEPVTEVLDAVARSLDLVVRRDSARYTLLSPRVHR